MQMVCSQSSEFRCSNACGNPLACGNHTCRSTCHFVTIPRLVAGEEVFQLDKLSIPPGIELAEPTNAPEGVWGKYGSSLPHEKCTSNGSTEDTSSQPENLKVVDSCEQCRLPCQKVCCLYTIPRVPAWLHHAFLLWKLQLSDLGWCCPVPEELSLWYIGCMFAEASSSVSTSMYSTLSHWELQTM